MKTILKPACLRAPPSERLISNNEYIVLKINLQSVEFVFTKGANLKKINLNREAMAL